MAQLYTKVKKYLEANSKTWDAEQNNIRLENHGSGDYIRTWNVSGLAKPNDDQIASYEDVANTEEALNVILSNRRNAYPDWGEQMDMQYHDNVDGTTTWKDAIKAVKDAYPKP
jgi:hypothetical protein